MGARIAITKNWNRFRCATIIDGEWFANEMLGVAYVVDEVDDHPCRFDKGKTKYQINSDIRACRDKKGGVVAILGNVWEVDLETYRQLGGDRRRRRGGGSGCGRPRP